MSILGRDVAVTDPAASLMIVVLSESIVNTR